ncbi:MAG TPA: glutamyl-tRNA reductase [Gammaproteobacteria bacterium]|nr:glutamyl-tRNA reductase [Gammaproteobacteria bacterium]
MPLFALGINHQTAPVEIRERLTFSEEQIPQALAALGGIEGVDEAVILSTCNRTEIYCALSTEAGGAIREWLTNLRAPDDPGIRDRFYVYENGAVPRHLMRVACGLDSLVIGEPQILGQLKHAYQLALDAGRVGPLLNRLFQHTFAVAKQVRTDTAIGANPVSVAFAAVSLARRVFGKLASRTALLIGAGETIELAARHLHDNGLGRMIVANRTLERAQELAAQFQGYAIALTDLPAHLGEADIVISSTASPDPVLHRATVEAALAVRRHRPVLMVDIAVPRDIEPSVGELEDVYLYTVDDLRDVIEENLRARRAAAHAAEEIIENQAARFEDLLRTLDAVPTIQALRTRAEAERDRTLEQARRMLAAGRPAEEVVQFLAHTLTNRLLHTPTARLRALPADAHADLLRAARQLFGLDDEDR